MAATGSVCGTETCVDVSDCPAPAATGTALPACGDVTGNFIPDCHLDCSDGRECPDGMTCEADTLCVWT
jgi:hypothetical protein